MEIVIYPADVASTSERLEIVRRILQTAQRLHTKAVCFALQADLQDLRQPTGAGSEQSAAKRSRNDDGSNFVEEQLRRCREDLVKARVANVVTFIGLDVVLRDALDIRKLAHLQHSSVAFDVSLVTLEDPTLLSAPKVTLSDLAPPRHLLLLHLGSTVETGRRRVNPLSFVLPRKKLPTRRCAMLVGYGTVLDQIGTAAAAAPGGLPELRESFRALFAEIVCKVRMPLLTGCCERCDSADRMLHLRSHRDLYPLVATLCGSRADMYAEATKVAALLARGRQNLRLCDAPKVSVEETAPTAVGETSTVDLVEDVAPRPVTKGRRLDDS